MAAYQFEDIINYDNNSGVVIADTEQIKARVEEMMRTVFGPNVDVTEETPMGRLVEMMTVIMSQTLGVNAQNANQYNINLASGIFLDAIGALYGIYRRAATRTRVRVTVTGTPRTIINTDSIAENSEGYKFTPESAITIGDDGTGDGYFVAMESGLIPCDKGTLTGIVSGVIGWDSINNNTSTPTIYGADLETDAAYRDRILSARATGSASIAGITNAIYASDNQISSAYVMENGYGQAIVKRGITIPAHSIYVCVFGGNDNNIAEAIFRTKTAGAGYTYEAGTAPLHTVTVTDEHTGNTYRVFFFRPKDTSMAFSVKVNRYLYAGTNLQYDIKEALKTFCQESGIGATITRENAVAYIASKIPSVKILSLSVGVSGQEKQDMIELSANSIPTTNDENITVEIEQ